MTYQRVDALSDSSVILALQELTETLPGAEDGSGVRSEADARAAVVRLLAEAGVADLDPDELLASEDEAMTAARRLLSLAVADPDTGRVAEDLVRDPPLDEQMSLEAAITGAVVLAALVGWLQMKISLHVWRKGDRTEFDFRVGKQAASPEVLRSVAETVSGLLGGNAGPPPP
ncbi:hypothetical protein AB0D78_29020 [Streptomyces avermitilis]|uniref:hypothetical protein n=1 Tax=Streptomyces avermitilis TaxID=33903 RepID=UPI0033C91593